MQRFIALWFRALWSRALWSRTSQSLCWWMMLGVMITRPGSASPDPADPVWPDTFLSRVEALALLETLNADLLSHDSATLTLERWCGAHRLGPEAKVVARLLRGADRAPSPETRRRLGVGDTEPIRYRRVQLACGDRVLSEADNWYVPARLTPEMNRLLDETDTPFGKAVQALGFHRETLAVALLWAPLPQGWEMASPQGTAAVAERLPIPEHVLEHRAILYTAARQPFAEVRETYTREVFAFPLAPAP